MRQSTIICRVIALNTFFAVRLIVGSVAWADVAYYTHKLGPFSLVFLLRHFLSNNLSLLWFSAHHRSLVKEGLILFYFVWTLCVHFTQVLLLFSWSSVLVNRLRTFLSCNVHLAYTHKSLFVKLFQLNEMIRPVNTQIIRYWWLLKQRLSK